MFHSQSDVNVNRKKHRIYASVCRSCRFVASVDRSASGTVSRVSKSEVIGKRAQRVSNLYFILVKRNSGPLNVHTWNGLRNIWIPKYGNRCLEDAPCGKKWSEECPNCLTVIYLNTRCRGTLFLRKLRSLQCCVTQYWYGHRVVSTSHAPQCPWSNLNGDDDLIWDR